MRDALNIIKNEYKFIPIIGTFAILHRIALLDTIKLFADQFTSITKIINKNSAGDYDLLYVVYLKQPN